MKDLNNFYLSLIAASMFMSGCTKNGLSSAESFSQTVSDNVVVPDLSNCKIRRIYPLSAPWSHESAVFTYNKEGNPYSIIYSNSGTGVHNHFFIYDSKNRLKEYQLKWGLGLEEAHYYRFNRNNQIIIDSAKFSDGEGSFRRETVSTIQYDALGSVVKETIVNTKNGDEPLEITHRPTYTYDNRGNLAVAGWKSSGYDSKINPLRQSPVFQFLMRNYSMNNAAPQAKYNSIGLPLSMDPTNDYFFNDAATRLIVYDCE